MHVSEPCPFCSKLGFRPIHMDPDTGEPCLFHRFTDGGEMATGETFRKIDKVYEETGSCPPHHYQRQISDDEDGVSIVYWECTNCGETTG